MVTRRTAFFIAAPSEVLVTLSKISGASGVPPASFFIPGGAVPAPSVSGNGGNGGPPVWKPVRKPAAVLVVSHGLAAPRDSPGNASKATKVSPAYALRST